MPRATCRCGHTMKVPDEGPERIICPKCGAKIRVRRSQLQLGDGDGFIRFPCPCGRRLKVKADGLTSSGKCPDCSRIVPVPSPSSSNLPGAHPEAPTEELSVADISMLDQWAREQLSEPGSPAQISPAAVKAEAGLRVCPRCGRPVHMGAISCRECGTHVPKRE